jgi:hypothetical protein
VLQKTCILIHSEQESMGAILLAQEVNELGSTLGHVSTTAITSGWVMPDMVGVTPAAECCHDCSCAKHGSIHELTAVMTVCRSDCRG